MINESTSHRKQASKQSGERVNDLICCYNASLLVLLCTLTALLGSSHATDVQLNVCKHVSRAPNVAGEHAGCPCMLDERPTR